MRWPFSPASGINRIAAAGAHAALLGATLTALILAIGLLAGCVGSGSASDLPASQTATTQAPPAELRVSGATTLRRAFEQIAPGFEQANNVKLVFNFGTSGQLQKQIEQGAPVDVFASASPRQVDALIAEGLVSAQDTSTFCYNDLVVFVPAGNPASITGPEDLKSATRLTTGNPDTAPHGTKTKEWLDELGLWTSLESRFVFGENAAQTLDYVARDEVDAGIGFASETTGRTDVEIAYVVPSTELKPSRYVAAPVVASQGAELAGLFVAYLSTPQVQSALAEAGFLSLGATQP